MPHYHHTQRGEQLLNTTKLEQVAKALLLGFNTPNHFFTLIKLSLLPSRLQIIPIGLKNITKIIILKKTCQHYTCQTNKIVSCQGCIKIVMNTFTQLVMEMTQCMINRLTRLHVTI